MHDPLTPSCSANAAHGVRRTNEDKRHAVLRLLGDAEWSTWSNVIAEKYAVDEKTVRNLRPKPSSEIPKIDRRRLFERKGTVYPQNTARIGSNPPQLTAAQVATPIPDDAEPTRAVGVEITGDPEYPGVRVWRCPKTNEDKRRAVATLFSDPLVPIDPETGMPLSDSKIAQICKVSDPFVGRLRALTCNVTSERAYVTKHGTVSTMNTSRIGASPPRRDVIRPDRPELRPGTRVSKVRN